MWRARAAGRGAAALRHARQRALARAAAAAAAGLAAAAAAAGARVSAAGRAVAGRVRARVVRRSRRAARCGVPALPGVHHAASAPTQHRPRRLLGPGLAAHATRGTCARACACRRGASCWAAPPVQPHPSCSARAWVQGVWGHARRLHGLCTSKRHCAKLKLSLHGGFELCSSRMMSVAQFALVCFQRALAHSYVQGSSERQVWCCGYANTGLERAPLCWHSMQTCAACRHAQSLKVTNVTAWTKTTFCHVNVSDRRQINDVPTLDGSAPRAQHSPVEMLTVRFRSPGAMSAA